MGERWIADASVIISLAKAGHIALLTDLSDEVLIPPAVFDEVMAGPPRDPARLALDGGGWRRLDPVSVPPEILEWGLGAGESEVISACLALGRGCIALLDDRDGRSCARVQGVSVKGTLGIVMVAARKGLVPAAGPIVDDLLDAGLRLDEDLVRSVLWRGLKERWRP